MGFVGSRLAFIGAAVGVWLLHAWLVTHFASPDALLSLNAVDGFDYDTHIGQTDRVTEALRRFGHTWAYDVQLLAGQPEGTIFDADNKGWEYWTYIVWRMGVPKGLAFNTFIVAMHSLVPLWIGLAAWLLGAGRWAALLAGAMASTVWWFDSWLHWAWWIGMISYASAAALSMVSLGLCYRLIVRGQRWAGALLVPTLACNHVLHPYSFFILALPLAVLYLSRRRQLTLEQHGWVFAAVAATLALNAIWLVPAFQHWHYILDSAFFGRTGLNYLVADFFNLLLDPSDSGVVGTRTGFRFLYLGLTAGALYLLWRERDQRRLLLTVAVTNLFILGYLGCYVPFGSQVQPYRHVMPLTWVACIGAALFVEALYRNQSLRALPFGARALLVVLGIGTVQHLATDVEYFMPDTLPKVAPLVDGTPTWLQATGYLELLPLKIPRDHDPYYRHREAATWLAQNLPQGDRVLIEDMHLGEHVAWRGAVEVLGGFRYRNLEHSYANLFRHYDRGAQVPESVLADYVRTYAVDWIVTKDERDDMQAARSVLRRFGTAEKRPVYKTKLDVNKVLHGGGAVEAQMNLIRVTGSEPDQDVVLSYHYHEKLVCTPDCRVEREPIEFDTVGLIRVPAPHAADLTISLVY